VQSDVEHFRQRLLPQHTPLPAGGGLFGHDQSGGGGTPPLPLVVPPDEDDASMSLKTTSGTDEHATIDESASAARTTRR
jgi:hypothetical protein